ncbi:MAG: hypothetical protein H0T43_07950 [Solirubrobacterales bacterium]|nr:hypothetical protein [Solirubrobacterales bacterium]
MLGTVAANLLDGDPVWLLVVGPPGGAKSEILQATAGLPDVHVAATLTEPALLSGEAHRCARGVAGLEELHHADAAAGFCG